MGAGLANEIGSAGRAPKKEGKLADEEPVPDDPPADRPIMVAALAAAALADAAAAAAADGGACGPP